MSRAVTALTRWWDGFWFAPGSPRNLAAARILVGAHALWILLSRDLAAHAALPDVFWNSVPPWMRWRFLIFPGHTGLEHALQWLTVLSLMAVVLGAWTRVSCLAAALLLYHLAPYETVLRRLPPMERGFDVTVLALVVLAFAPCAEAWSARRTHAGVSAPSWQFTWPLALIQLFLAQVYLFSGIAKLHTSGLAWVSADNIRNLILAYDQATYSAAVHPVGLWIAAREPAAFAVAVAALAMDLGFIAAVVWKRSRPVLVPAALLFHFMILLTTTIYYLNWPLLFVFVDWDALRRRMTPASRLSS